MAVIGSISNQVGGSQSTRLRDSDRSDPLTALTDEKAYHTYTAPPSEDPSVRCHRVDIAAADISQQSQEKGSYSV